MSAPDITQQLDALIAQIVDLSANVGSERRRVEAEYSKAEDPDQKPIPVIEHNEEPEFSLTVYLPTSDMSLSDTRKWLGEVQSALVAADKKLRSLAQSAKPKKHS